jgi:hypothetical protein
LQLRLFNLLISPNEREKIELSGPHEGAYGFRLWRRKRKVWRRDAEIFQFDTYARAVVEAAKRVDWLGQALTPPLPADSRLTYHLELLRGHTFQFSVYTEACFGDHDHCSACRAKIAEGEWADFHQGYVTRYRIPDGSGHAQWNWLCEKCFSDLKDPMQWQIGESGTHV